MKNGMYAVFDTAAAVYKGPFQFQSDGQAVRWFKDVASDAEHEIGKHPEDYSLCRVGQWDDNKGNMLAEPIDYLITGLEAVAAAREPVRADLEEKVSAISNGA